MAAFQKSRPFSKEVEVTGHLIDSMILTRIFDKIMDLKGDFEVLEFEIGKRKKDPSRARLLIKGSSKTHLEKMLHEIHSSGAVPLEVEEAVCVLAPNNMVLPNGFYSSTNNPTQIFLNGRWVDVENLMMDKAIVVSRDKSRAICTPVREVKKGDLIVVGETGVKIFPPERPREGIGIFEFMSSKTSSEKPISTIAERIAGDIWTTKKRGQRVAVVAGPAVVHTGVADSLSKLIRMGFVDVLLAGNALAVHDVEYALYGTSLGIDISKGTPTPGGNRNHMSAVNEIFRAGSLESAVKQGVLKKGIFYECIKNKVPFVLAGSIRDDGPIPGVITDVVEAQKKYKKELREVEIVIMLSTMLHSIAVGNMLPSTVKVVALDISPSTVTKLLDRGTGQAIGVVSDIGAFMPLLVRKLETLSSRQDS